MKKNILLFSIIVLVMVTVMLTVSCKRPSDDISYVVVRTPTHDNSKIVVNITWGDAQHLEIGDTIAIHRSGETEWSYANTFRADTVYALENTIVTTGIVTGVDK
jgi:hypothetical protein